MNSSRYNKIFEYFKENYKEIYGIESKNIQSIKKGDLEILVTIKSLTKEKELIREYKGIKIKYLINNPKIIPIDPQNKERDKRELLKHIIFNEKSF